jgi:hypothetical protein
MADGADYLLDNHSMASIRQSPQYSRICRNGSDQCCRTLFGSELPEWPWCHADSIQVYGPPVKAEGEQEGNMEERADIEMPLLRETDGRS